MLVLKYMERGSLHDLSRSDTTFDGAWIRSILQDVTQTAFDFFTVLQ